MIIRSMGTTLAAAIMGTILASNSTTVRGFAIPDQSAFHLCFIVGAVAAFAGVAITATIPRRTTPAGVSAAEQIALCLVPV